MAHYKCNYMNIYIYNCPNNIAVFKLRINKRKMFLNKVTYIFFFNKS